MHKILLKDKNKRIYKVDNVIENVDLINIKALRYAHLLILKLCEEKVVKFCTRFSVLLVKVVI
jgi:hypothetical protein